MNIRHARPDDLNKIMEIYQYARTVMAQSGNPGHLSLKIFEFLNLKNINYNITTVISIAVAVIIYIFACFFMKILKKNEILESVENRAL